MSAPARQLDGQGRAVVAMEFSQRLDHQVVDRKPDRPAPVGVAAVDRRGRLAGLVGHSIAVVDEAARRAVPATATAGRSRRGIAPGRGRGAGSLRAWPGRPAPAAGGRRSPGSSSGTGCRPASGDSEDTTRPGGESEADARACPVRSPGTAKRGIKPTNERTLQVLRRSSLDPDHVVIETGRTGSHMPISSPNPLMACEMATKCSKNLVAIAS